MYHVIVFIMGSVANYHAQTNLQKQLVEATQHQVKEERGNSLVMIWSV